jgi:hypothetical protein
MSSPKFAPLLPGGHGLDWSFRNQVHYGQKIKLMAAPSNKIVLELWDKLDETNACTVVAVITDAALLALLSAKPNNTPLVNLVLLKNKALPLENIWPLFEELPSQILAEVLFSSRSDQDLARIYLKKPELFSDSRSTIERCGAGAALENDPHLISFLINTVPTSYTETLLRGMLQTMLGTISVESLSSIMQHVLGSANSFLSPRTWSLLGQHLGEVNDTKLNTLALKSTQVPELRVELLVKGAPVSQILSSLSLAYQERILELLGQNRVLTMAEAKLCVLVPDPVVHYNLKYDDKAIRWIVNNGPSSIAAAVVWRSNSDVLLAHVLRTNPESHSWVGKNISRANSVWPKLSSRHKTEICNKLPESVLYNILPGNLRSWIVDFGPGCVVGALSLQKSEIKRLLNRVTAHNDSSVAWIVARLSERPKERVLAALVGMQDTNATKEVLKWLERAGSDEIVKFWRQLTAPQQVVVSAALVDVLRVNEDIQWINYLVEELTIPWQAAPESIQIAAAKWLEEAVGDNDYLWEVLSTLYVSWVGTLADLLTTAKNI